MTGEDEGGGPEPKRRRVFSRKEALEKLEELEGDVAAAVGNVCLYFGKHFQILTSRCNGVRPQSP